MRAWIGLAPRRDIRMADHAIMGHCGNPLLQGTHEKTQSGVLLISKTRIICADQFDSNREVIDAVTTGKMRSPGVPGASSDRDVLHESAHTINQKM